jgi:uncharacterized protein (TIGR03084 family)
MTSPDFATLLRDLAAEEAALDRVVAPLDEATWRTPTPAAGWDVRDSVAHLACIEDFAHVALTDADEFARQVDAWADAPDPDEALLGDGRSMTGDAVLTWWRDGRAVVIEELGHREPRDRIPWFAGPMSAMSFATARLMETWAHGRDVRDALGAEADDSARLRHVADLGVRTRPFAYAIRGMERPDTDVRVELRGPDGESWSWGNADTADVVRGSALDFCLVVTQRANPADTGLAVQGPAAQEWLSIAQAFAGAPTDHRPPRSA